MSSKFKFSTFARFNGLALVIEKQTENFAYVRYCGDRGMRIRRDCFWIHLSRLEEF